MISWIIVAAEIAALAAVCCLLSGKNQEKTVLLVLTIASVPLSCLALYLAEEPSKLMQALCFAVTLSGAMRLERIWNKKRRK